MFFEAEVELLESDERDDIEKQFEIEIVSCRRKFWKIDP